jgi:RNA polymerase sigma factor (sigma-70 family)
MCVTQCSPAAKIGRFFSTAGVNAMSDSGSISLWLAQLKEGDGDAAQRVWERYYHRLVGLARKKLGDMPRRANDEEDVVQSALNSFFVRARNGNFPQLKDRDDLWSLLVVITARKALNQRMHQRRAKRGGGLVRGESILDGPEPSDAGIAQIVGDEPTPEFAAQVTEQLNQLMDDLDDPTHRVIALWKLEGRTNPEIARHLDCSLSAVERKLRLIRQRLSRLEKQLESELTD